ncbi:MAG: hypothetical protein PHQ72_09550 [Hespellia sp.]|nr:hypothetical protein [Hespellia sp.]
MKKDTIRFRATNILISLILIVVVFLFVYIAACSTIILETSHMEQGNLKALILLTIIFGATLIFLIMGGLSMYNTRFIEILDDKILVHEKVGELKKETTCLSGKMKNKCEEFLIEDIQKIGYSSELYGHPLEFHQGKTSYQIKNYEMVFELVNGEKITIDISQFSRKSMRKLFLHIYKKIQLLPEKKLRKDFYIYEGLM